MVDLQIVVCAPAWPINGRYFDPAGAPYSKYTQVNCPRCHLPMWLGERSRIEVETERAVMMCAVCAVAAGYFRDGDTIKKLTDRDA